MPYSTPEKQRAYQERRKQRYREDPELRARAQAATRAWAAANPERLRELQKRWTAANPDRVRASQRKYQETHPEKSREAHLWRKHGLRPDALAEIWNLQGGNCYLCLEPLGLDEAVVDHDHRCCPKDSSCRLCRRGLTHNGCNVSIGHASDNPALLRLWADNLDAAQRLVEERIAVRPEQLALDITGE